MIPKMHWFVSDDSAEQRVFSWLLRPIRSSPMRPDDTEYLTSRVSEVQKLNVFFIETECRAKGDRVCRFVGQPRTANEKTEKKEN